MALALLLAPRAGPRPRATTRNPHSQLDQNAPPELQDALAARIFALPDVEEHPSLVSVPGARALWLSESIPGNPAALLVGREFAHLHPPSDGSLHLALPPELAERAVQTGWAEFHPMARLGVIPMSVVMVYGPRDAAEVEVVASLVEESWRWARRAE